MLSSSQFLRLVFSVDVETVRCPFCVADNDFRRMMPLGGNRYACLSCWHVTALKNKVFQCQCVRCIRRRARVEPASQPSDWLMQEQEKLMRLRKQPGLSEFPDFARASKLARDCSKDPFHSR